MGALLSLRQKAVLRCFHFTAFCFLFHLVIRWDTQRFIVSALLLSCPANGFTASVQSHCSLCTTWRLVGENFFLSPEVVEMVEYLNIIEYVLSPLQTIWSICIFMQDSTLSLGDTMS